MSKILLILSLFFINKSISQNIDSGHMINIELKTILKDSSYAIPQSITEVISNSKRVGIVYGDYDGVSLLSICSNKIIDKKITLKVYAINCKPFTQEYLITEDIKITIKLEYGESEIKSQKERDSFVIKKFGIPFCGTTDILVEELENANYRHCSGQIKKYNEIPSNEIHEWDKIE